MTNASVTGLVVSAYSIYCRKPTVCPYTESEQQRRPNLCTVEPISYRNSVRISKVRTKLSVRKKKKRYHVVPPQNDHTRSPSARAIAWSYSATPTQGLFPPDIHPYPVSPELNSHPRRRQTTATDNRYGCLPTAKIDHSIYTSKRILQPSLRQHCLGIHIVAHNEKQTDGSRSFSSTVRNEGYHAET